MDILINVPYLIEYTCDKEICENKTPNTTTQIFVS